MDLAEHRGAAGQPEKALAQIRVGYPHLSHGVRNEAKELLARVGRVFHFGPDDLDAAAPGIDRDRLGLGLHRADVLAVDEDCEILEVGAQFLHIGHLNLDRHVQRGECEIALAALFVSLHLAELHRILRTHGHDRDGAAAVAVIQPSRRLGTHREDEVEFVFFRELDRFLARPILQIEVDDRKLDLVLARLEYLEYF